MSLLWPALERRARVRAALHAFFRERGYLEVETPVRVATPALERYIDAEPAGRFWLRTSPEFHMKRLLAEGAPSLYQIGPCFRREERGRLHRTEFTLVEWYRVGADHLALLDETRDLVRAVVHAMTGEGRFAAAAGGVEVDGEWVVWSVSEAFQRWAGWDPVTAWDEERFERDLLFRVEPALPRDRPCVLIGYPSEAAGLAALSVADPRLADRWELYLGGVELINACRELTDAAEQRRRFARWADGRRREGRDVYPLDRRYLRALERGLPPCAGAAMGLDRLVMLLSGAESLDQIMLFPDPEEEAMEEGPERAEAVDEAGPPASGFPESGEFPRP
jgi:lysyl-tRNA synthetase class 2